MPKLVIVESPAKARTIEKYLGKDYRVAASVGHVVDLPRKSLGVDIARDFQPTYEVMPEKKAAVAALKKAADKAEEIFLAPDPDREGEAIAWHIADILRKAGKPMRRVLINEITKPAVLQAVKDAGELNRDLFEAQQARRVLDRLVGYLISPLLSKKFRLSLSAGRVQSVALRLVVDRERVIRAFKPQEYWSIEAKLAAALPPEFSAKLAAIAGKALEAPGDKFDPKKKTFVPDRAAAAAIIAAVSGKPFIVKDVSQQERRRNPYAPFITSTLQQEAAKKLGFTAKKTMTLAQRLYEGQDVGEGAVGLITYMRTDSPRVSEQAISMVREFIKRTYGEQFLPGAPVPYKSKKGAQEAHEAIRPTAMDRSPEKVKPFLDQDMFRLYELIFLRFTASQMKPAVYDQTTVDIPVDQYLFRASGRVTKFKGFLAVYEESIEDENNNKDEAPLPPLKAGDRLKTLGLAPEQHFTKPPPRFTEASLVKELEEKGIGRPSTYAAILSTIQDRKYVEKEQGRFQPTPLGERITDVLVEAFPDVLDVGFTAGLEEDLDKIEEGKENWVKTLKRFYDPFKKNLDQAGAVMEAIRQDAPTDLPCPKCGKELTIKWSKKGEFVGCSAYPECKFTSDFTRGDDGEISLVERKEAEVTDVVCDKCGSPMVIRKTRKDGREFLSCSAYPKCKNAQDFIRDEQGKIKVMVRADAEDSGISCDKCGSPMVIKKARKSGKEFLSCSAYPKCKNAKDMLREADGKIRVVVPGDHGPACELCGKPQVLKMGRFGTFWKCETPDCPAGKSKKAAPAAGSAAKGRAGEPLPDEPPCEKCGKPMVQRQGRFGPFIACSGYPACKNIRKKGGKEKADKAAPGKTAEKK
jgi:DNA topoisomerase-1